MDAAQLCSFSWWEGADEPDMDRPPELALDERRLQVRAYNRWSGLLRGRAYPSIEDIRDAPGGYGDAGVVLDFSAGPANPRVAYLGPALREECGLDTDPLTVADVPTRSLLSRLTDNYLRIIANRAPIGFEAEFVSRRGHATLYRGVLMPCSSDDVTIDHIYGAISWKELADAELTDELTLEVSGALRGTPPAVVFAAEPDPLDAARAAPALASVALPAREEFVMLLARRSGPNTVDVLASLPAEPRMIQSIAGTLQPPEVPSHEG